LLLFFLTNYATAFARQPIRYRSGCSVPENIPTRNHTLQSVQNSLMP